MDTNGYWKEAAGLGGGSGTNVDWDGADLIFDGTELPENPTPSSDVHYIWDGGTVSSSTGSTYIWDGGDATGV